MFTLNVENDLPQLMLAGVKVDVVGVAAAVAAVTQRLLRSFPTLRKWKELEGKLRGQAPHTQTREYWF